MPDADATKPTADATENADADVLSRNVATVERIAAAAGACMGPGGLSVAVEPAVGEHNLASDGASVAAALDDGSAAGNVVASAAAAYDKSTGDGSCALLVTAGGVLAEASARATAGAVRRALARSIVAAAAVATEWLRDRARPVESCEDVLFEQVALSAACGDDALARLCLEAARAVGADRLIDGETFSLTDGVISQQGWPDRAVAGIALSGGRLSALMPATVNRPELLLVDGDLQAHEIVREAMASEVGIRLQAQYRDEFFEQLRRIPALGVGCLIVGGRVSPAAREQLVDAGILVIADVGARMVTELAAHTGATAITPLGLRKTVGELRGYLGSAEKVSDTGEGVVLVEGGRGRPTATLLVGGITRALAAERAGRARAVLASLRAALRGGVLPGGGAAQLSAAEHLRSADVDADAGAECLRQGLRAPAIRIADNCGFYDAGVFVALERAHADAEAGSWAIDARNGRVVDMYEAGVADAADVITGGIAVAAAIAAAILTIERTIPRQSH